MTATVSVYQGDALDMLSSWGSGMISAACFSPPYGVGAHRVFDVRKDFTEGGRFLPYAEELSRVCLVWAINLTQVVHLSRRVPFQEQLILALAARGVECWDSWVIVKPSVRPSRGPRALVQHERVLLFTTYADVLRSMVPATKARQHRTVLPVRTKDTDPERRTDTATYYPEIPRAVFGLYGGIEGLPVLDPFAGTGTSLHEAQQLGLSAAGIELDPGIFARLQQRFSKD